MSPSKRIPFGDPDDVFRLEEGCAVCDDCGGDGGGAYPARWSYDRDEPDYDWAECAPCEGTGQVRVDGRPHEEPSNPLQGDLTRDLDEEIPF